MNVQIRKWIGLVALVVSTACVISYAEKGEGKSVTLPDVVKNAIQKAYPPHGGTGCGRAQLAAHW